MYYEEGWMTMLCIGQYNDHGQSALCVDILVTNRYKRNHILLAKELSTNGE